jgi:hypothetical protein
MPERRGKYYDAFNGSFIYQSMTYLSSKNPELREDTDYSSTSLRSSSNNLFFKGQKFKKVFLAQHLFREKLFSAYMLVMARKTVFLDKIQNFRNSIGLSPIILTGD